MKRRAPKVQIKVYGFREDNQISESTVSEKLNATHAKSLARNVRGPDEWDDVVSNNLQPKNLTETIKLSRR